MNILMSGSTGFVGKYLSEAFLGEGWRVIPLRREDFKLSEDEFQKKCEGADIVINLAGAPVAGRWTEEYKKTLYSSRIDVTSKIIRAVERMEKRPELFISTSAIGIYSSQGTHTEESHTYNDGFLGKLALAWEKTALKAQDLGIRTVIFRFGVVLGRDGGALQKMLIPFRIGLGGIVGDGKQAFSWIHIEDLKNAYFLVIGEKRFSGTFNLTSPNPVTNEELTRALAGVLGKPAVLRVPAFVLRLQYGEGAKIFIEGQTVLPGRLLDSGFKFTFGRLEQALADLVK